MLRVFKIKLNLILLGYFFCSLPSKVVLCAEDADKPKSNSALFDDLSPKALTTLIINDADVHIWDRYVRKFRRDHHLSIQSTYEKGQWVVGSFGRIENEEFPSTGFDLGIQYSFHIQLESKFGYYLGTLAGYFIELEKRGQRDFGPSSMWKLPGLLGGLVYNYSATGRVSVGAAGYLSRIVKLSAKGLAGEDEEISVTGETFDYFLSWERFVSLNSAIKIQYVNHRLWVPPARDAERFALDARIKRFSQGVSLGATYHFL